MDIRLFLSVAVPAVGVAMAGAVYIMWCVCDFIRYVDDALED